MRMTAEFSRTFWGSVVVLLVSATPAAAQSGGLMYRLVELPAEGSGSSKAYALNNTGQIVGWMDSGSDRHGAHWHVEVTTDLHGTVHFDLQHPYLRFTESYSEAYDISNADQIVGTAHTQINCPPSVLMTEAFLLRPGVLTDLASPYSGDALTNLGTFANPCLGDAWDSAATGISNRNHVVGWADLPGMVMHAFLVVPVGGEFYRDDDAEGTIGSYANDLMIDLGTLRGDADPVSAATAVNDWGQVTGYSYTFATPTGADNPVPKAAYRAFLINPNDTDDDGYGDEWFVAGGNGANTLMEDIGSLGGYNSWGRAINDDGDIVGESDTDPDVTGGHYTRAFLWADGSMTDLGTLGGTASAASGVNSRSAAGGFTVVGWAENADNQRHAFLYQNGEMSDLNDLICLQTEEGVMQAPSITLSEARDVNDDGWIVGWGEVHGSGGQATRGFLLIPMDPNDCLATDESSDGDNGSADPNADGTPAAGMPIVGTAGNMIEGTSTSGGDQSEPVGSATPAALCGMGTLAFLPLMLAGLTWWRVGVRTRVRRRA